MAAKAELDPKRMLRTLRKLLIIISPSYTVCTGRMAVHLCTSPGPCHHEDPAFT